MKTRFQIRDLLSLEVEGAEFCALLEPYRVNQETRAPDISLTIAVGHAMPADSPSAARCTGRYKSFGWSLTRDSTGSSPRRIVFAAPRPVLAFLAHRMVLMPLLKQALIAHGGFTIPASVARNDDEILVFFGRAGAGKTRALLDAISKKCTFVADNEIAFLPGWAPFGLFDEIELRRATVKDTAFWQRLTAGQRARLTFCAIVSLITGRRLNPNLSLPPAALGLTVDRRQDFKRGTFVVLGEGEGQERLNTEAIARTVAGYERWYQGVFGDMLFQDPAGFIGSLETAAREYFHGWIGWRQ